ncbi:MAG: ABC transporter ATP-binding protein [Lachnospiraceae bacterium]|nr:ABC transporter ATP-binding protein [Lachnospiraceae bacterium]
MKEHYFFTEKMTVGYHGKPLIKKIEIDLPKGKILTLIGPNGAGKSTILKSIARQLELIDGAIYLSQKSFMDMKREELAKKMSVVFTEKIKTEMMTCEEVVSTGRYPYTGRFGLLSREDERIVKESMKLVQVTEIRNEEFEKVSDGQKQRVMLARAMCQEPEVIILDEPTSYLDIKFKLEFLSILQEMRQKKGLTVIMSLHELELAQRVSDKILCVKGDYIERYGTPEEIFTPGYIKKLFDIHVGSFDEENGSMELEKSKEEAKIFVIAGGGSGKNTYRMLQRKGKAFVTGILYENDLDCPAARALAQNCLIAEAFEPIEKQLIDEAKARIDDCQTVICCKENFGTFERANQELLEYAKRNGKEIKRLIQSR